MSDLISRQAAIDALISEGRSVDSRYILNERIILESDAIEAISMLPSAEPKKGKWIDEGWYADGHDHHVYCCSKCGEHYIKCPDEIIKFKYCPNCGASMGVTE